MKLLIKIFISLLLMTGVAQATTIVAGCGLPSSKTVQIRIYDITDAAEDVAWTSTSVSERADGQGSSCYRYSANLETAHAYQIDWKDNSSPVNTASEIIPQNTISTVTVATNQDKTGYTATNPDLTSGRLSNIDLIDDANAYAQYAADIGDDIYTETSSHPTLTEIEASTLLAKKTDTNTIQSTLGSGVVVSTVNDKTGYALSSTGIDAIYDEAVEGTLTSRQLSKILLAVLAGKSSGSGTTTILFKGLNGTTTRVTATVDGHGNRTGVSVNGD
jgi:hypothetical protein